MAVHFRLQDANGGTIGAIDRNFVGFARELFTDTGQYAIHMDSVQNASRSLSLDERAVLLACAMNIVIDYFSWHSRSGIPIPFFLGGGTWGGDDGE